MSTAGTATLTRGPELRGLLAFSLPLTAANLLQQGYLLADAVILGRFAGAHALAAVGAAQPFSYLIAMTFAGLSTGFTVRVARLHGSGDARLGPVVPALGALTLAWWLGSAAVVAWWARPLLELSGIDPVLAADARGFLLVLCAGLPALLGTIALGAWLRGLGIARAATGFMVVGSVVNVALAWWFVGGLRLGLTGGALATVLANTVALVVGLAWVRRAGLVRLRAADVRAVPGELRTSLGLGAPLAGQQLVVAIGAALLLAVISPLGERLLAGVTVVLRLEVFTAMVFFDLGGALTTFVAQNAAAGAPDRVRAALGRATLAAVAATAVLSALVVAAAPWIAAAFVADPGVQRITVHYLVLTYPFFVLFSLIVIGHGYLNGVGRTLLPLLSTLLSFAVVRLGLAWWWRDPYGVDGVIWAVVADWAAGAAFTAWAVRRHLRAGPVPAPRKEPVG